MALHHIFLREKTDLFAKIMVLKTSDIFSKIYSTELFVLGNLQLTYKNKHQTTEVMNEIFESIISSLSF